MSAPVTRPRQSTGLLRWVLLGVGWASVGLGLVGAFLPLLPTTPFLLLAAACFLRTSPELNRRMLEHDRLGPYLVQWRRDRSLPPGAKPRALFVVLFTFSLSIYLVDGTPLRVALAIVGVVLLVFLALLRTASPPRDP